MTVSTKLIRTYAKSLFQNTLNNKKKEYSGFDVGSVITDCNSINLKKVSPLIIGEELLLLGTLITLSKPIKSFFQNPTTLEIKKKAFLLTSFPGLTLPTKSFIEILTERGHLSLLPEISSEFSKLLAEVKNLTTVKIVTASRFPKEKLGKTLLKSLKSLTLADEIIIKFAYNPKLLGGFIIEYESCAIDATVLKELSLFFNEA